MVPEIGPISFGALEKRVPGLIQLRKGFINGSFFCFYLIYLGVAYKGYEQNSVQADKELRCSLLADRWAYNREGL